MCIITGMYDSAAEGEWKLITCDGLNDWQNSNWAPGQPNDVNGDQDCAQLLETGQWNDWTCSRPMQYICELNMKGGCC